MIRVTNGKSKSALLDIFRAHYKEYHPDQLQDVNYTNIVKDGKTLYKDTDEAKDEVEVDRDNLQCASGTCTKPIKRNFFFNHWNSQHSLEPITNFKLKNRKTGQVSNISVLYSDIGQCKVAGCGQYYGANTYYHPLKRVAMEHFRRHHGNEQDYEESKHMIEVNFPSQTSNNRRSLELPSFKKTAAKRQSLESGLARKQHQQHQQQQQQQQVVPPSMVQCPLCQRTMITVNILQHWTKHGRHPASLRVMAVPERTMVSLKHIFQFIFKCDAPGCQTWVGSNVSDKDCISKVREHWGRAHNVQCLPKSSQVTCH